MHAVQAAAGLSISVLNNLLAAGIVSLVNERQWGRVFQATRVLQRLDQLPAPRLGVHVENPAKWYAEVIAR